MQERGVVAHATVPHGSHSLLRTLRTHGGLSEAEARSSARLPFDSKHLKEPFGAAAEHYAQQLHAAARDLLSPGQYAHIRVVGAEPMAEWFARALAQSSALAELFPQGEVRALRPAHLSPYLQTHSHTPDLMLMLGALFIDGQVVDTR
jgi:hypothetical protein